MNTSPRRRRTPREPTWLQPDVIEAIHDELVMDLGGLPGVRDTGLRESALGRPLNQWHYGETHDVCSLAAAYGFGIAKNHPFNDGNKRTAFQAMFVFLFVNGRELDASEVDAVNAMLALADGSLPEAGLAAWLRMNSRVRKKPK